MSREEKIQRGGLARKMAGYTPEPPGSVWEGVASEIGDGGSGRKLLIFLAAAAGLALAVTVGVLFLDTGLQEEIALQEPVVMEERGDEPGKITALKKQQSPEKALLPEEELSLTRKPSPEKELSIEEELSLAENPSQEKEPSVKQAGRLQEPSAVKTVQQNTAVASVAGETTEKKPASRLEEKVRIAVQEVLGEAPGTERVVLSETVIDVAPVESAEVGEDEKQEGEAPKVPAVQKDSLLMLPERGIAIDPETDREDQSGKWQLGASLSPLYNYRDVTSQDDYSKALANSSETARLTFAGGVQVNYQQSKRLTVESGLYYTRMGVNIGDYSNFRNGWFSDRLDAAPGSVENVVSISNSMGKIVSASNDLFVSNNSGTEAVADYHMLYPELMMVENSIVENFSQSLEYLEIPLNIKYLVLDRSVQVQLIGGVSTNVMINNSVSAHTGEGAVVIGASQDLRSLNYSGNAGIGIIYDLFESFSLSVEPKFRYYLYSVNKGQLPSTRPYTFGLYTGVNYTF